jgi:hypothetical protein
MDEAAAIMRTGNTSLLQTEIEFETHKLFFQLRRSNFEVEIFMNPNTNCLQIVCDLRTRESYLASVMYEQQDKAACSASDQPNYGSYLLRVADAWNLAFGMRMCKLHDAATFEQDSKTIRASFAYSRTHNGLTWYMAHGYIHRANQHQDISNVQENVDNTNELIRKLNAFWDSSARQHKHLSRKLGLTNAKLAPWQDKLRDLDPVDILYDNTNLFYFEPYFVKYYPQAVQLVDNQFELTDSGQKLLADQLRLRHLWKIFRLGGHSPELKEELEVNGYPVADPENNITLKDFPEGPTQYMLASDVVLLHSEDACELSHVWNMHTNTCAFPRVVLANQSQHQTLTRDSVSVLLWAGLKVPQPNDFWRRYELAVAQFVGSVYNPPAFASECAQSTANGLRCLISKKRGQCEIFCKSQYSESLVSLRKALGSVFIVDKSTNREYSMSFLHGKCRSKKWKGEDFSLVHHLTQIANDVDWPLSCILVYEVSHPVVISKHIEVFGNVDSHIVSLSSMVKSSTKSGLVKLAFVLHN